MQVQESHLHLYIGLQAGPLADLTGIYCVAFSYRALHRYVFFAAPGERALVAGLSKGPTGPGPSNRCRTDPPQGWSYARVPWPGVNAIIRVAHPNIWGIVPA